MRTAITLARTHAGKWVMLATPDDSLLEQKKNFRAFRADKSHPDYNLVTYQESDGHAERNRLMTPEEKEADDARRAAIHAPAAAPAAPNGQSGPDRARLNALSKSELFTLASDLFTQGRLDKAPGGTKSTLIEAILSAKPAPDSKPSE